MMTDKIDELFRKIENAKPFIYRIDGQHYFYSNGIFRQCTDVEIKVYNVYQQYLHKLREEINDKDKLKKYCVLREIVSEYRKCDDFELLIVMKKINEIECKSLQVEDIISLEDMKWMRLTEENIQSLEQQIQDYELVHKGIIPYLEFWFKEGEILNEL